MAALRPKARKRRKFLSRRRSVTMKKREPPARIRQIMLAMIDKGKPERGPSRYWAPFVLVGEGAIAK